MSHAAPRFAAAFLLLASCNNNVMVITPSTSFSVRESVEQLHVTHAKPGVELVVLDASQKEVQKGTADELGSFMFRKLPPGDGYLVRAKTDPPETTRPLRVMSIDGSKPPASFYKASKLVPGFNYIKTRDGTTLSAYVTLPGPIEKAPYPTVVDYSGYAPSKPGQPVDGGKYSFLCDQLPVLCDAPNDPAGNFAALAGFATVSVNMRGTGCSGGAYDYFERLQLLDGYDVIETVAAQDWVLHNKVGMVGISYPGISQLFVATEHPPGLAAISPMSVIGNSATTLVPGGILNNGFAVRWVTSVLDEAAPYGQGWEKKRVEGGDDVCGENQLLHGQRVNNVEQAYRTQFYDPALHDFLNPTTFVDKIEVPVFLCGSWEDEQTGPFFNTLLDKFTHAPLVRQTVYNGVHPDAFAPAVLVEWKAFLDLFVAQRKPSIDPLVRSLAPPLYGQVFGSPLSLPPDRFAAFASYEEALAAYKKEPQLHVLFESGGGDPMDPGAPVHTFERSFGKWPPAETKALRLFFQTDGTLGATEPTDVSAGSSFTLDAAAGQRGILAPGGNPWDKLPSYDWQQPVMGAAVSFVGPPLTSDIVLLGTASADLWIRSTVDDADVQVSISEVRPDGQEMYVQSGWLRASGRALAPGSTELWPEQTHTAAGSKPLVPGEWTAARVAIPGFQHVFRMGSRVRVLIDTPGGSRAEWRFQLKTFTGAAVHDVGHAATRPSSIVLPVVEGVTAPSPLPACPSLRGQQCRPFASYANTPAN